jgi:hypothetical protein
MYISRGVAAGHRRFRVKTGWLDEMAGTIYSCKYNEKVAWNVMVEIETPGHSGMLGELEYFCACPGNTVRRCIGLVVGLGGGNSRDGGG